MQAPLPDIAILSKLKDISPQTMRHLMPVTQQVQKERFALELAALRTPAKPFSLKSVFTSRAFWDGVLQGFAGLAFVPMVARKPAPLPMPDLPDTVMTGHDMRCAIIILLDQRALHAKFKLTDAQADDLYSCMMSKDGSQTPIQQRYQHIRDNWRKPDLTQSQDAPKFAS